MPEMEQVESSMIHSLGYDHDTRELHVRFRTGRTYKYENVSLEDYYALASADSVGQHFNNHIKNTYKVKT